MELYHKITKEVLELLLREGGQMPVDLARKLQRSSSNMQQVREHLSKIGCINVTKQRNYYELKISDKGTQLLEAMRRMESLDKPGAGPKVVTKSVDMPLKTVEEKEEKPEIKIPEEPKITMKPKKEVISRGGRTGILARFG